MCVLNHPTWLQYVLGITIWTIFLLITLFSKGWLIIVQYLIYNVCHRKYDKYVKNSMLWTKIVMIHRYWKNTHTFLRKLMWSCETNWECRLIFYWSSRLSWHCEFSRRCWLLTSWFGLWLGVCKLPFCPSFCRRNLCCGWWRMRGGSSLTLTSTDDTVSLQRTVCLAKRIMYEGVVVCTISRFFAVCIFKKTHWFVLYCYIYNIGLLLQACMSLII